jgi:DNA-binding CsgD family transcriptional regulator
MLERGVEQLDRGLIALDSQLAVRLSTGKARHWLGEYFPGRPLGSGRLPDALHRWTLHAIDGLDGNGLGSSPEHRLTVEGPGGRLTVRLVADPGGPLLFLHEERADARPAAWRALGLSPREAEVLTWVTEGKTNPEIAVILGLSPRTVQTHLDRIFRKLGVESRAAAVAAALKAGNGE